ncbi:MAG: HRDC domain-containing protein [PVC group bacterium]
MSAFDRRYDWIDDERSLSALAGRIADAARAALDTEADSLHHYYEKVCLIQVSISGDAYIVDPLAGMDLSVFFRALAGRPLILHGADYDLRMLRSSFGFRPRAGVFDTMLAGQLLGHEQPGLATLAGEILGVVLVKGGQKFDWSRRPLPEAKLAYAADDTRYLEPLADRLRERLCERGREEWHRETCDALVQKTGQDRPGRDPDDAWRIKGLKDCSREQLAFVRGLWHWREKEAREADLPPFKVMGNELLLELALWARAHPGQPARRGPRLPRTCREKRLDALEHAVREARGLPPDRLPPLRKKGERQEPLPAKEATRLEKLRDAAARVAGGLGLPSSVLAPRAALEAVVRAGAATVEEMMESGGLLRWQASLLAEAIRR